MNDERKSEEAHHSFWRHLSEKIWDLLPWAIPALVGAAITGGLTIRDNHNDIADIQFDVASLQQDLAAVGDCVKRPECEAVRAILGAHETRIRANEVATESHESSAREWKNRIVGVEDDLKRIMSMHSNRVVPDDLKDLDQRIRDLERYKDLDEERMKGYGKNRE